MGIVLLFAALLIGLFLIPLGLPGLWLMVGAALVYSYVSPGLSLFTLIVLTLLAVAAEVLEFFLSGSYARRYGGSRRAGWGAILGGIVGAVIGIPIPILGSMLGAFAGSFAGAWIAERSRGTTSGASTRVATGALLGRIVSVAVKVGVGLMLIVAILLDLLI